LEMPRVVGSGARVVDDGHGLTIDELAGNVATKDDRISIAYVRVSSPTAEPWLTLEYDEWMCVLKGRMVLKYDDGRQELEVVSGQTVFIGRGERFKPEFPEGGTEYVPVCLPAFRPDRCIREDAPDSAVSKKLKSLHGAAALEKQAEAKSEVLYHMCQKSLWETAKRNGEAYFPPTFEADGYFTHATAVPSRLIATANHFYQEVAGEWVCLRILRTELLKHGIFVRDEQALPVGKKPVSMEWESWICPHIVGGIPPSAVKDEFPMVRDGPQFLRIEGVTD